MLDLLQAADEQYVAVVDRDRERLERVTCRQEQLSFRLARAEARRLELLGTLSLQDAIAALPEAEVARVTARRLQVAEAVRELKARNARTTSLLVRSIELGRQTLDFLQRLVTAPSPAYGAQGLTPLRQSVLVDGRA